MGFAHADGAGEEQPFAGRVDRIGLDEFARGQVGAAQRSVGTAKAVS